LAATLGLVLAMIALGVAAATGDSRWDGIGSVAIGVVLIAVAIFLAIEIKSLLVGEAADGSIGEACRDLAKGEPHVKELLNVITVQQGPGQVMVAIKARFDGAIQADQIAGVINTFESKLRERCPEVKWIFMEPDLRR
jgi:divalent metal cation (Fe/Co/Zn/Cd) transporter